jgi:RNA-directed DNA polymerase
VTDQPPTSDSTAVPTQAKPVEATPARWSWVAPEVWTARMLTALDQGVKGGRWYTLMDKVAALPTLRAAFTRVKANRGAAGVDHVTVAMFEHDLDTTLTALSVALRTGTYRPQPIRRQWIPKPGTHERRPLGIPTVRDRVVQTALRVVLDPIFDAGFADHSYGVRPGRGAIDARRRVATLLAAGYTHVVDADLQAYFDTIPHRPLRARVETRICDGPVLALLDAFLRQPICEGLAQTRPAEGTPQGAVISPLLANLYLDPLDHLMAAASVEMVRYADDFVVLCRTAADAQRALTRLEQWTTQAGLRRHPQKTQLVDMTQPGGFDFLGYHFERNRDWPRQKSRRKLKDTLRPKTQRTNGRSVACIIADVNRTLRGWFEYFKHSHGSFQTEDQWVRNRLRAILRKRGSGHGHHPDWRDHRRWPNAFFVSHGLFSLMTAHATYRQSLSR